MKQMRSRIFLVAALLSIVLPASQSSAATAVVRDGSTLQLGNVTYRLDGIDAPAVDQFCIDQNADSWTCGIEARDQLSKLIDGKQVRCDDLGADPVYKKRRIGACKIEGDATSLSESLISKGFAVLDDGATSKRRIDQGRAMEERPDFGKAASSARASSAQARKTASCSAVRAAPIVTGKSARPCSPKIS